MVEASASGAGAVRLRRIGFRVWGFGVSGLGPWGSVNYDLEGRGYGKWSLLAEADGRKARPAKH